MFMFIAFMVPWWSCSTLPLAQRGLSWTRFGSVQHTLMFMFTLFMLMFMFALFMLMFMFTLFMVLCRWSSSTLLLAQVWYGIALPVGREWL